MSEKIEYNFLTFSGKLLNPGFSIYLFEPIHKSRKCYYYLGMTGDNFYPSARSAIHRLSGHFERAKRSTQNQMNIKLENFEELNPEDLEIKMHHWSIAGFEKWEDSLKNFKPEQLSAEDRSSYNSYKVKQRAVLKLENALIYYLKNDLGVNIINRTGGVQDEAILNKYAQFKTDIEAIVKKVKIDE